MATEHEQALHADGQAVENHERYSAPARLVAVPELGADTYFLATVNADGDRFTRLDDGQSIERTTDQRDGTVAIPTTLRSLPKVIEEMNSRPERNAQQKLPEGALYAVPTETETGRQALELMHVTDVRLDQDETWRYRLSAINSTLTLDNVTRVELRGAAAMHSVLTPKQVDELRGLEHRSYHLDRGVTPIDVKLTARRHTDVRHRDFGKHRGEFGERLTLEDDEGQDQARQHAESRGRSIGLGRDR